MKKRNAIDKIAFCYDYLAYFVYGNAIRVAQTQYLDRITSRANILVLGGGTGWWLPKLLDENTTCSIWYIDASEKMITYAKRNSNRSLRVKFVHGTHENIPNNIRFNAVITFFFLDMMDKNTLSVAIDSIKQVMHHNSIWLVADFVNKKRWHSVMLSIMYFFFNMINVLNIRSLPNWEAIMQSKKFNSVDSKSYFGEFIHAHIYQM